MCDNSGTIYTDDDKTITIDLEDMDLGDLGLGIGGTISLNLDDLDEQTKKELLVGKPLARAPNPECRWCRGTGKVKLLVSESDCDCVAN